MADTKSVGPYEWQVPLKGVNPWDGHADVLIDQVGDDVQTNKTKAAVRATLKWGDVDSSAAYLQADHTAGVKVFGSFDRQNLPIKGLTIEVIAKPGAPTVGRVVMDDDKLWFAGKGGGAPVWVPLTRPTLTVSPDAGGSRQVAEFSSLAAALAAMPSGGGTIQLLPGTYAVTGVMQPAGSTRITGLGDGVILDFSASPDAQCFKFSDKKDVVIENVRFTGAATKSAIQILSTMDGGSARIQVKNCRFAVCKNAIEIVESAGDWQVDDVLVEDCYFDGTNAACESAVYSDTEIRRVAIRGCFFKGWGNGGNNGVIEVTGNAGAGVILISDCTFDTTGTAATDFGIFLTDVDDVLVARCYLKAVSGSALRLDLVDRCVVADCVLDTPSAYGIYGTTLTDFVIRSSVVRTPVDGGVFLASSSKGVVTDVIVDDPSSATSSCFELTTVNDTVFTGCVARAARDGFLITTCDRSVFSGCQASNNTRYGFNLASATYLVFAGCIARSNATADLTTGGGAVTNCRLGLTLSVKPTGVWDASNGVKQSIQIPIRGWSAVDGGPAAMTQVGASKRFGWAMDSVVEEIITGDWLVPENKLLGTSVDFRVWYVGTDAPGAGDDSVSFTVNVLDVEAGVTLIDAAGANASASGQLVNAVKRVERSAAMAIAVTEERLVQVQIKRTVADAGDDYAHDVYVVGLEAEVVMTEIEVRT